MINRSKCFFCILILSIFVANISAVGMSFLDDEILECCEVPDEQSDKEDSEEESKDGEEFLEVKKTWNVSESQVAELSDAYAEYRFDVVIDILLPPPDMLVD